MHTYIHGCLCWPPPPALPPLQRAALTHTCVCVYTRVRRARLMQCRIRDGAHTPAITSKSLGAVCKNPDSSGRPRLSVCLCVCVCVHTRAVLNSSRATGDHKGWGRERESASVACLDDRMQLKFACFCLSFFAIPVSLFLLGSARLVSPACPPARLCLSECATWVDGRSQLPPPSFLPSRPSASFFCLPCLGERASERASPWVASPVPLQLHLHLQLHLRGGDFRERERALLQLHDVRGNAVQFQSLVARPVDRSAAAAAAGAKERTVAWSADGSQRVAELLRCSGSVLPSVARLLSSFFCNVVVRRPSVAECWTECWKAN